MRALLDPWLAYLEADLLQDQKSQAIRMVQFVTRSPLDANFSQLPPGLVFPSFIAVITCFWIRISKDPTYPGVPNTLGPTLFQICAPGTNSIGITWKLVRNVESWATELESA